MDKIRLVIGIIILVSYFAIVPTSIGIVGDKLLPGTRKKSFAEKYIWGNIFLWALFQILCVPLDLANASFDILVIIYGIIIIALLVGCYIFKYHEIKNTILALKVNITLYELLIIALILIQIFTYIFGVTYAGGDDTTYISASQYAVEKNGFIRGDWKLLLTSWNYYIAFLGKITGIHVVAIAHTILPVWLVPMAYMVYSLIGRRLFQNERKKIAIFMFWMTILVVFGGYSWYVLTLRLAVCIWHGKAVMASIMLPFLFYYLLSTEKYNKKSILELILIVIATISMSLMGVGLTILMILANIICRLNIEKIKKKIPLFIIIMGISLIAIFYGAKLSLLEGFIPERISGLFPQAVDMVKDTYQVYWNHSNIQWIYYPCLAYVLLRKRIGEEHSFLKKYIICIYMFIFNPIVFYVSYCLLETTNVYVRLYYILFVEIFISYALTLVLADLKKCKRQVMAGICGLVLIVICGKNYWELGQYSWFNNIYKLPDQTIELSNVIGDYTSEDTWLVADLTTYNYIQQYSSQFRIAYIYQGQSLDEILTYMKENSLQYLVWNKSMDDANRLTALGASEIASTDVYTVYKFEEIE